MTLPENHTQTPPEQPGSSPWRRLAAVGTMGVAGLLGTGVVATAHEAANDIPPLVQDAREAGDAAEHFGDTYERFAHNMDGIEVELDSATGQVTATIPKDGGLTLNPLEQAFSHADNTEHDIGRLKWLSIGGIVALSSATVLRTRNRPEGQRGKIREAVADMSREHFGHFAGLMISFGAATGLLGAYVTKPDAKEFSRLDAPRAFELIDTIEEEVKKLNVEVTQGEKTTTITFQADQEAIASIEDSAAELATIMPEITDRDILESKVILGLALLTGFGATGTAIGAGSAIARLPNRQERRDAARGRPREPGVPHRGQQEKAALRLATLMGNRGRGGHGR